ncbi:hypothetical protein B4145_0909 [Bacillus subtilis]|uniref:Uncharacterized protein n=1 Tax=Bacillus subtilis subsp. subtilis TaxID=135461 RepID=A0ABD3ZT41_BACIU|nr:hypothetical protein B4067_0935 [Bacillus subtilis subsp. subtilis]KIN45763.1 hypothetical protein B4145_0909 [Bacillus subtilis]
MNAIRIHRLKKKQNCKTLFCYTKRMLFQEHPQAVEKISSAFIFP